MFDLLDQYQFNELHVRNDAASGLKAFIAIHNTQLGCMLVAGSANVPLFSHELGQRLHKKSILYASWQHAGRSKSITVEKSSRSKLYAAIKQAV